MPVRPNLLERLVLFRLNRGPAPVLDLFAAGGFEAVGLAIDIGVFDALADGSRIVPDLAAELDADPDGLRTLLAFLDALGYVAADADGNYANTSMTETWLTDDGDANVAPWFAFWRDLVFPYWRDHLETAVREGEPPQSIYDWFDDDPSRWETAQRGFRAAASVLVDEVTDAVSVPDGGRVLDVGGGHGLYAVELCRRHPGVAATVFDHPDALDVAADEIAAADLGDRMGTRGGDYWTDDLGDGYDLALLFNVVHAHDAAENTRLFERVRDALAPGGRIAVLDQFAGSGGSPVGRAGVGFVGLTYLVTLGATLHPFEDVADWLQSAGFENVERTAIRQGGPGNTLVEATTPE